MTKKELNKLFKGIELKFVKKELEKSENPFAVKILIDGVKLKVIDFSKQLEINDIIKFNDSNNIINKAIVTGKGKHGVTCRNKEQKKIRIRYKDILDFEKRIKEEENDI